MGGQAPTRIFFLGGGGGNFVSFCVFCVVFMFPNVPDRGVGSDQSEFFSDFWIFLSWQDPYVCIDFFPVDIKYISHMHTASLGRRVGLISAQVTTSSPSLTVTSIGMSARNLNIHPNVVILCSVEYTNGLMWTWLLVHSCWTNNGSGSETLLQVTKIYIKGDLSPLI